MIILKSIVTLPCHLMIVVRRLQVSRQFLGSFRHRAFRGHACDPLFTLRVQERSLTRVALYARTKDSWTYARSYKDGRSKRYRLRSVCKEMRPAISASDTATALLR